MAAPTTERFEQMTLELSENGTTWSKPCGIVNVTISRSAQFESTEVPADCLDESLPLQTERSVRSLDVTVSADGVWSAQSNKQIEDWFYSGQMKYARIGHQAALTGDPQYEQGRAYMSSLNDGRTKGAKVTRSFELVFDGTPTRTNKA